MDAPSLPQSFQGQLLLASSRLVDPNFARAVVLMISHSADGSLGLVLNRRLEMTVKEACEQALETTCEIDDPLHQGGPCEGPLMVLHTQSASLSLEPEVIPGIHFTTDRERIEGLLKDAGITAKYFVGYSGWGPGQLEAEMEVGSWIPATASKELIFDEKIDQWSKLMTASTLGQNIRPEQIPDDPSMN
jgi:putative transcriptional regulator